METEKIMSFLGTLSDLDYRFLRIQCSMADDASRLIHEFHLSKERFCDLMKINPLQYDLYLNGGFRYSTNSMARMQAAFINLNKERYEKEVVATTTDIITKE